MNDRNEVGPAESEPIDPDLANLAEQITRRLQAGDPVDPEEYARNHPDWGGLIHGLMPTLRDLADLGRSAGRQKQAHAPDPDPSRTRNP